MRTVALIVVVLLLALAGVEPATGGKLKLPQQRTLTTPPLGLEAPPSVDKPLILEASVVNVGLEPVTAATILFCDAAGVCTPGPALAQRCEAVPLEPGHGCRAAFSSTAMGFYYAKIVLVGHGNIRARGSLQMNHPLQGAVEAR